MERGVLVPGCVYPLFTAKAVDSKGRKVFNTKSIFKIDYLFLH